MRQAPFPPPPTLTRLTRSKSACPRRTAETRFPCVLLRGSVRIGVDALLQDRGRLEHHHAPRRNRNLFAGLRVAADSLTLFADHERAERRQLHGFAPFEAIRDLLQYHFNESRRLSSRQPDLLVHGLAEVRPRHRLARHRPTPLSATTLST